MERYKIGTEVITPEGEGVVRKNEKHSRRQGVKVGGFRSLRWYWPDEMKTNTGEIKMLRILNHIDSWSNKAGHWGFKWSSALGFKPTIIAVALLLIYSIIY